MQIGFVNGRIVGQSEAGRVASAEAGNGGFDGSVADTGTEGPRSHQLQVRSFNTYKTIQHFNKGIIRVK